MASKRYEEWGIWSYRTRWTSGVGGTTGITHDLSAGAGNVIHVLQVRASAVIAATGTLDIDIIDEDAAIIVKLNDLAAAAGQAAGPPGHPEENGGRQVIRSALWLELFP